MPEGPEVQVVISTLQQQLTHACIQDVEIRMDKLIQNMEPETFARALKGQSFHRFYRIGKYLGFETDDYDWIVHLRMEGKFYIYKENPDIDSHVHAVFYLEDGRILCYHDTRKFGRMALYPKAQHKRSLPVFAKIGKDFRDPSVDPRELYRHLHRSNRPLKAALLDQSILAGIGNIYADEICFACGLDPRSRCCRVSRKDCENIVQAMHEIMERAVAAGGTTIRSYTSSLGITGLFQLDLDVHGKKGQPCPVCQRPIDKIVVAQRGTYLCRHCQKRK